jgi:polar amino acid transport system permease protein
VSQILHAYPLLLRGAWITIQLTVYSAVVALVLAMVFGVTGAVGGPVARAIARVYVEFFRGSATLVLMFWLFYALPLVGFRFQPMAAGVLALSLNYGAYGAEVVRGALNSVDPAQREGGIALSFTPCLMIQNCSAADRSVVRASSGAAGYNP